MKMTRFNLVLLAVVPLCGNALIASADEIATNRLSFSARVGWNVTARFKNNVSLMPAKPPVSRRTPSQPGRPDGDAYNYDDGYVSGVKGKLSEPMPADYSGNYGDMTWYWGYDDTASQLNSSTLNPGNFNSAFPDNTILLSHSTTSAGSSSRKMDDDPLLGGELVYNRLLGVKADARFGIEAAANYMNMSMRANVPIGRIVSVMDAYPYAFDETGTTRPPNATPDNPYQGSYMGPGFILTNIVAASATNVLAGTDSQKFEAELWGFRLGPYMEIPLGDPMTLSLSAGLALGVLDADASWRQTLGTATLAGRGHDTELLWGGYLSGALTWYLSEHWSAIGGVQFQTLGEYEHSFGGRKVEVDLSNSWFVTLGLSYTF